jgi:hypothetical protein
MLNELKLLTVSNRLYHLLLRAYPAPFRREFGREMALVFRDDLRATVRKSGVEGLIGLWLVTFFDLLKTALAEHIWEMFHMPLEKLSRWSWLAIVIGGPLPLLTFTNYSFWDLMQRLGLSDNDWLHPLLAGMGLLLTGIGLYGLYRRLPQRARPASTMAYGAVLFGVLLGMVGFITFMRPFSAPFISASFILLWIGLAVMGLISLSTRALGELSFVPLLIIAGAIGIAATVGDFATTGRVQIVTQLFLALYHISWLMLGIALWKAQEDKAGPPLLA